jgi:hypothetical protein
MNEFKDPLNPAQRRVKAVVDSFREEPNAEPMIRKIAQGFQERFGLGKYVTHAYVSGEVGEVLDVHLGGIDLSKRLPQGSKFRGFRGVAQEAEGHNPYDDANYHHYNKKTKECGLVVETAPDAQFKLTIGQTRINGLIILHEMGHAWSDHEYPDERKQVFSFWLSDVMFEKLNSDLVKTWYEEARNYANRFPGIASSDLIKDLFINNVRSYFNKEIMESFSKDEMYGWVSVEDRRILTEQAIKNTVDYLTNRYKSTDDWYTAYLYLEVEKGQRRKQYTEYRRKYVKMEETRAWDWAEAEAKRLQKVNPKIRLWDGNDEELRLLKAFFILHHPELNLDDIDDPVLRKQLSPISDEDKRYHKRN